MTLADARTRVRYALDDTETGDPERFADAELDTYLEAAISHCLRLYVSWGGTRFLEAVSASPDASGEIDLSTYDPIDIHSAALVVDGYRYPIDRVAKYERGATPDSPTTFTVQVLLHRHPTFPSTTTDFLVGLGSTSRPSFYSLDNWICLQAALEASLKDKEPRRDLLDRAQMAAEQVRLTCGTTQARAYPQRFRSYRQYAWTYEESDQTLEFCLR